MAASMAARSAELMVVATAVLLAACLEGSSVVQMVADLAEPTEKLWVAKTVAEKAAKWEVKWAVQTAVCSVDLTDASSVLHWAECLVEQWVYHWAEWKADESVDQKAEQTAAQKAVKSVECSAGPTVTASGTCSAGLMEPP